MTKWIKKNFNFSKPAFTLLETAIFITIGALIILVIAQIFISQTSLGKMQVLETDLQRNATFGIETLKSAAQTAKRIMPSRDFGGILYASGANVLVLELPSVDSGGNLIYGNSDYIVFSRNDSNPALLMIITDSAPGSSRPTGARVAAAFVEALEFRYNNVNATDSDMVDAFIVTSSNFDSKKLTASSRTRIKLRNR